MTLPLLPLLGIGLVGGYLYVQSQETDENALSPKNLPTGLNKANRSKSVSRTKNGRKYTVHVWPERGGKQFAVACLDGTKAWVSYNHDIKTKKRKLYRAYGPGDNTQAGRVVSQLMGDWGVAK